MRVLLLPSIPYGPLERLAAVGDHPRPGVTEELRRDHGIDVDTLDPDTSWKNPFGRMHPFFRGLDPLRSLRVLIARRNYDLIVSGNDGAAVALTAARGLFWFRTPIVIWDLSPAERWRVRIAAQNWTIPRSDGVIAVNDIQKPYIAQRWGKHVPVITVPHWVDTEFYHPMPAPVPGPILTVGDDAGRDYPTLLGALENLSVPASIRTSVPLTLTERHQSVTILRDRLTPRAFRDLYANCRFVVVPLRPDTRNASGNSTLLEAAAMGKAVVVSDSDGIRGFVRHEETGLIVPANDPIALRAAIERLLADPAECERMGQAARELAERTASPGVFAERLAAAFRALAR
ncbi:MAG: glycosyltransferase [Acetobacteraceae bacterium]|nr:glycosyltransferase [Acetobacteraceae bacterium]